MSIDSNDVENIAHLARLQLAPGEVREVTERITDILALIDQMQSVSTDNVTPLAHTAETTQRLRPDRVTETNRRDALQTIAPSVEQGLYLVPRVIE